MNEEVQPLLVTKLTIPLLKPVYVPRAALLRRLDAGLDGKLMAVLAGAGFGKTTLLAEWSAGHPGAVAWLALDAADNHPLRFLAYVVAALQTCLPDFGMDLLARLRSPEPPTLDMALYALVNALASVPQPLALVLDDYHVIDHEAIHEAVVFLLDYLPPQVTLVVASRADPPLQLSRLRARGELLELRVADLRFSAADAAEYLNGVMQLGLSAADVEALESRTEGWIAGLQLAALALRSDDADPSALVREFSGSHRYVLDYLLEEVLALQPEPVRRFLLETSFLKQLTASLCDAVTGGTDSQRMLETLERHNLFVVPLDSSRRWYRYHHLFADLLQAHLLAEDRQAARDLNRRAAHWHAENGLPEAAIGYALDAEAYDFAADLISGPGAVTAHRGHIAMLMRWYRALPPGYAARDARLGPLFGMAFALNGRWQEAEALLKAYDLRVVDSEMNAGRLLRAYLLPSAAPPDVDVSTAGDLPGYVQQALQALALSVHDLRGGSAFMAQAQHAAEQAADATMALTALFHRCRFDVLSGALTQAEAEGREALRRLLGFPADALPAASLAHVSLGRVALERNTLSAAAEHLARAMQIAEASGLRTGLFSSATMMQAEVLQGQGEPDRANEAAVRALAYAQQADPPEEAEWLRVYQARVWLVQGNISAAAGWLRAFVPGQLPPSRFYPPHIDTVTRARVLLAQRQYDAAITLLHTVTAAPPHLLTVEALAALALARAAQGDHVHARLVLQQALTVAEPESQLRPFIDLGAPLRRLLLQLLEAWPEERFARVVLAALPGEDAGIGAVERLSDRELDVLRLIVAGLSNDEIAQALTIAPSTVKWYVNVLYGKLHVKTRAQAIARAHALHLLAD
jgi:LuxR family maltose regulon positive regulatory protein